MNLSISSLDVYLPAASRTWIEERFYARINAQAKFEAFLTDARFWQTPSKHVALFSDHGVVHVQDVALQTLHVLDIVPGLLIAARPAPRLEWMKGYGVALSYLHDIGMIDFSAFGRAVHAEFAAHTVFTPEFDEWVTAAWPAIGGGFAARLQSLKAADVFHLPLEVIARELFALAVAHSKSKTPVSYLNDPAALRASMLTILTTSLSEIYQSGRPASGDADLPETVAPPLSRFYAHFEEQAYSWLLADAPEAQALVHDVIDTLRAIRCADALRQRGTVQKTSGGYEVFANQETGHAIYALRHGSDRLYLLELEEINSAGEANIASCELNRDGNLRISFHLGAFTNEPALEKASYAAAYIVNDIQGDVIESFEGAECFVSEGDLPRKTAREIHILLENTADRPEFVTRVVNKLHAINPKLEGMPTATDVPTGTVVPTGNPVQIVPSLRNASSGERVRYLAAPEFDWDLARRLSLLKCVAETGHRTEMIDPVEGFRHVREALVRKGETLIEAGAPPSFVYLPLAEGLRIFPLGGYEPFSVQEWMLLGITGVIRGAVRNADVKAEEEVPILIIPQDVYMAHWHQPYCLDELDKILFNEK